MRSVFVRVLWRWPADMHQRFTGTMYPACLPPRAHVHRQAFPRALDACASRPVLKMSGVSRAGPTQKQTLPACGAVFRAQCRPFRLLVQPDPPAPPAGAGLRARLLKACLLSALAFPSRALFVRLSSGGCVLRLVFWFTQHTGGSALSYGFHREITHERLRTDGGVLQRPQQGGQG